MRTKHLDRSRSYGEIHPPGSHGAHYEQDGYHFDHDGKLVAALLSEEQKDALSRPEQPKQQKAQAAPALTPEQVEALSKAGVALTPAQEAAIAQQKASPKGDADPKDDGGKDGDGLNLERWLKGEAEYDLRDVQKAVKARFGKWATKPSDLVQFLVDPKDKGGVALIPAEQVGAALKKHLD